MSQSALEVAFTTTLKEPLQKAFSFSWWSWSSSMNFLPKCPLISSCMNLPFLCARRTSRSNRKAAKKSSSKRESRDRHIDHHHHLLQINQHCCNGPLTHQHHLVLKRQFTCKKAICHREKKTKKAKSRKWSKSLRPKTSYSPYKIYETVFAWFSIVVEMVAASANAVSLFLLGWVWVGSDRVGEKYH